MIQGRSREEHEIFIKLKIVKSNKLVVQGSLKRSKSKSKKKKKKNSLRAQTENTEYIVYIQQSEYQ